MNRKLVSVMTAFTRLSHFTEILSEIALVILMLMVFREVIWRYLFNSPSVFSVEISEYLLIFMTFMCAGWVLHHDRHVSMTVFTRRLSPRQQVLLDTLPSVITMGLCLVIIWKGIRIVTIAFQGDYRSASLVNFPLWISYSFIPAGMTVLFLQYIVRIHNNIIKLKDAPRRKQEG